MLDFGLFTSEAQPVSPGVRLGQGITLVFDGKTAMEVSVRHASPGTGGEDSLVITGANRAREDWFGLEVALHLRRVGGGVLVDGAEL